MRIPRTRRLIPGMRITSSPWPSRRARRSSSSPRRWRSWRSSTAGSSPRAWAALASRSTAQGEQEGGPGRTGPDARPRSVKVPGTSGTLDSLRLGYLPAEWPRRGDECPRGPFRPCALSGDRSVARAMRGVEGDGPRPGRSGGLGRGRNSATNAARWRIPGLPGSIGAPGQHHWRGVRRVEPILHVQACRVLGGLGEAESLGAIDGALGPSWRRRWACPAGSLDVADSLRAVRDDARTLADALALLPLDGEPGGDPATRPSRCQGPAGRPGPDRPPGLGVEELPDRRDGPARAGLAASWALAEGKVSDVAWLCWTSRRRPATLPATAVRPSAGFRWHYRSRHHSLIAVSNREFYDGRLYVVPSPTTVTAMATGSVFRHVKRRRLRPGRLGDQPGRGPGGRRGGHRARESGIPKQSLGVGCLLGRPARRHPRRAGAACSGSMPSWPSFFSIGGGRSRSSSRTWRTSRGTSGTSSSSRSATAATSGGTWR